MQPAGDDDLYGEEPPDTVEEVEANPALVEFALEFDPGNLETADIEAINSVVLGELFAAATEEQGVAGVTRRFPGIPGGGFTKHSKSHSKYGGHSKVRSAVTADAAADQGEPRDPDRVAARPRPHSKTPGYSKSYSKYIHGKVG